MMPLLDRQRAFAAALEAEVLPEGLVQQGRPAAARRFGIYRANVALGLVEALRQRFPVTERLVGEAFFHAMARAFVACNRPQSPVMLSYGGGFANFIASFGPAAELPYLADLARLEFVWGHAYHAADADTLDAGALAGVAPESLNALTLTFHPSVQLLRSAYPVAGIWSAHQGENDPDLSELVWEPQSVMLVRPDATVNWTLLQPAAADMIEALMRGDPLAEAAAEGLTSDAAFDPGQTLVNLFHAQAVTAIGKGNP